MSVIYAHRGASGYAPENTLESFALAMEMGADGFELDVHLSKDGQLIVMHDEKVDRTTNGTGLIVEKTLEEIKALDASNHMDDYAGAKVPTLGEVYDLIKDTNHVVNVEIKTDAVLYKDIEKKCIALEKEKGMGGRILYSSFNHYTLMNLRALDPTAKIGLLYSSGLYEPWKYAQRLKANAIHPAWQNLLLPGIINGCLENGVMINPWTVNSESIMRLCIESGIGVITNYPDKALKIRSNR